MLKNNFSVVRGDQREERYFEAVSLFPALTLISRQMLLPAKLNDQRRTCIHATLLLLKVSALVG